MDSCKIRTIVSGKVSMADSSCATDHPQLMGHFVVYIVGYIVRDYRCIDHNSPAEYPWEQRMFTTEGGWAIGDNSRNRPCSRLHKRIRRFSHYDEAVAAIDARRRKYPNESHQLIYRIPDQRKEWRVGSLDEALSIDAKLRAEDEEKDRQRKEKWADDYPERERLEMRYGYRSGFMLAQFLGLVKRIGFEQAIISSRISRSTAYRYRRLLAEAGVDLP
ncbi:MAG: hypothetical protein LC131_03710 [Anaerolineae bacterium]|nr:hypothetical protein [Anaerolineae bacterium]